MKTANENACQAREVRIRMMRYSVAMLGIAFAFAAVWFSALEVWQRPLWAIGHDEHVMRIAAICASAIAVLAWPGRLRRFWFVRVGVWAVAFSAVTFFFIHTARQSATRTLLKHDVVEAYHMSGSTAPVHQTWDHLFQDLRHFFERHAANHYDPNREYLPHLIETSRWPVRRAWIERMLGEEGGASLVTREWSHYFPAVVGQDVTLRNRRTLIERLHDISHDPSFPDVSRDAAVLWMGLIVLTDPVEFAVWRVPVRDSMIDTENPPFAMTGDIWMRMIDMLLAFDTPEEAAELTRKLTKDYHLMRRALRERVRGLDAHVDDIIQTIEDQESTVNIRYSVPMFVDLVQMVSRMSDEAAAARTRQWIQNIYLRWIRDSYHRLDTSHPFQRDLIYKDLPAIFQEDQMPSLLVHAEQILNSWSGLSDSQQADFIPLLRNDLESQIAKNEVRGWTDTLAVSQGRHAIRLFDPSLFRRLGYLEESIARWEYGIAMSPWIHSTLGLTEAESLGLVAARGHYMATHREHGIFPADFSREAIEIYLDACERAAARPAGQPIRIGDDGTLDFTRGMFVNMARVHHTLDCWPRGLPERVQNLLCLVLRGIVSAEYLEGYLLPAALESPAVVHFMLYDPFFESFSHFVDPADDYRTLRILLEKHDANHFLELSRALRNQPLAQDAIDVILAHFLRISATRETPERIAAYKILFESEEYLAEDQRDILRAEFADFLDRERPSLDEWDAFARLNPFYAPLSRTAWRDDAFTARFGWAGSIYTETALGPMSRHMHPDVVDEVFYHLAMAYDAGVLGRRVFLGELPMPSSAWNTEPAALPFAPTPWQRARALHLRRPDLDFPDRAVFRPTRRAR